MDGRVCVVTGANTGIGFETACGLAAQGAHVVLTVRTEEKAHEALAAIEARVPGASLEVALLDLGDLSNVRAVGVDIREKHRRIDVLVNNAGVILEDRRLTVDGHEMTFAINYLGHYLLTRLLAPSLIEGKPGRVINVSSEAHRVSDGLDFDDLQWERRSYSAIGAYADSKLANLLFTRSLSRRLDPQDVTVHAVHPGAVRSRFGQDGDLGALKAWMVRLAGPLMKTPEAGAATTLFVAQSDDGRRMTGGYFADCKVKTPTSAARDDAAAHRLWSLSAEMVGLQA